jgi:hypothetical protein
MDEDRVDFTVDGNTINATLVGGLSNYEGVTLKVQLPDGYFANAKTALFSDWVLGLIVSGALLLICILLFLKFGIDPKIFPTVEFYPPDDMTPSEAGYVIDGTADNEDIISLITYWADKGYLEIKRIGKDDFELIKSRSLPADAKSI